MRGKTHQNLILNFPALDDKKPRDASEEEGMVTTTGQEETEVVDMSEAETQARPTTTAKCPEGDNDEAYWYMRQIRAADESETRFFVCTECEHRWREDDH
ncbi:transcription factor S [Halobacteriales archaeon QH_10_67_13]|nr:MAG: transcription factor S [Halobacteriales archaeon QH_10_67_13]